MAIDTIKATAILDGAVDTADLADGAVTAAKITDGEVTDAKIASGITSSKLTGALPAIDGSSLTGVDPADGSITTAKLDSTLDLSGKTVTYGLTNSDMPTGSILQVVSVTNTSDTTVTSSIDFITASITPTSTSSKILVMGVFASVARRANTASEGLWSLYRGGTNLGVVDGITPWNDGASNQRSVGSVSFNHLDSPSTTSAITYKMVVQCSGDGVDINDEGGKSSLTLMEVAG